MEIKILHMVSCGDMGIVTHLQCAVCWLLLQQKQVHTNTWIVLKSAIFGQKLPFNYKLKWTAPYNMVVSKTYTEAPITAQKKENKKTIVLLNFFFTEVV